MEPRRRRTVRVLALTAGALWIAYLASSAASPAGDQRVEAATDGTALLLQVLALVLTVATVAVAATAGAGQREDEGARARPPIAERGRSGRPAGSADVGPGVRPGPPVAG